jgi:hypothetical protein
MPQQEQISELISDKVFTDLAKLTAELAKSEQQLIDNLVAANNFNQALGNSRGAQQVQAASANAAASIERVSISMERQRLADIRLQQQRERSIDNYNKKLAQQEAATARTAAAASKAAEPYNILNNSLKEAERNALNLGAQFGGSSQQYLVAAERVRVLRAEVDAIEQPIGRFQRNVGNYASSIAGYFSRAYGLIRTAANIIPGLGISGIFLLAFEGAKAFYDYLDGKKNVFDTLAAKIKLFNDVNKESSEDAGKQVTTLNILYKAATDVTNSTKDRIAAAKELKKEYPEAFENSKIQAILNGEESGSFKQLTADILAAARAKAVKGKLDEIEAKILENDIQKQKIFNAQQRELAKVTPEKSNNGFGVSGSETNSIFNQQTRIARAMVASRANAAKNLVDQNTKILEDQKKFLVDYAGGNNQIAKTLINPDKPKVAKDTTVKDQTAVFNELIEAEKKRNELVQSDEASSYDVRLESTTLFIAKSIDLIKQRERFELSNTKLNALQREKIEKETQNAITGVRIEGRKEIQAVEKAANNDLLRALKEGAVDQEKAEQESITLVKEASQARSEQIALDRDSALVGLSQQYAKQKIGLEEYNKQKSDIEHQASQDTLRNEIATQEKIVAIRKLNLAFGTGNQKDLDRDELLLSNLKIKLSKDTADQEISDSARVKARRLKDLDEEKQAEEALQKFVVAAVDARYTNQLNALKKQSDAVDTDTANQIAAVERSLLSTQQKADKEAVINAQASAKKAQITKQENEIKHKQDVANKEAAELSIVINTAAAVVKTLGETGFFGIPLSLIVGGIGLAELATVIATPLPQYFTGTEYSKAGPAIVGERGTELVIEPSGKTWLTPEVPTMVSLTGGSKIINNKELMQDLARPPELRNVTASIDIDRLVSEQRRSTKELKDVLLAGQRNTRQRGILHYNDRWEKYKNGYLKN